MKDLVSIIKNKFDYRMLGGVTEKQIDDAEKQLGVKFSKEYRSYLNEFGAATFGSHEFTGICSSKRLNVVDVTEEERVLHPEIPNDFYVIERLDIDDVIIWQSSSGEVYQSLPNLVYSKVSDSLQNYL